MSPGSSISLLDLKSSMKDTKTLLGAKWHVTACISALIPPKEYIGFGLAQLMFKEHIDFPLCSAWNVNVNESASTQGDLGRKPIINPLSFYLSESPSSQEDQQCLLLCDFQSFAGVIAVLWKEETLYVIIIKFLHLFVKWCQIRTRNTFP